MIERLALTVLRAMDPERAHGLALKALPVLMLGGLESITGAIAGGIAIGLLEKLFEIYWGQPLLGGSTEAWFAYVLALVVLLFRQQGLFGAVLRVRIPPGARQI